MQSSTASGFSSTPYQPASDINDPPESIVERLGLSYAEKAEQYTAPAYVRVNQGHQLRSQNDLHGAARLYKEAACILLRAAERFNAPPDCANLQSDAFRLYSAYLDGLSQKLRGLPPPALPNVDPQVLNDPMMQPNVREVWGDVAWAPRGLATVVAPQTAFNPTPPAPSVVGAPVTASPAQAAPMPPTGLAVNHGQFNYTPPNTSFPYADAPPQELADYIKKIWNDARGATDRDKAIRLYQEAIELTDYVLQGPRFPRQWFGTFIYNSQRTAALLREDLANLQSPPQHAAKTAANPEGGGTDEKEIESRVRETICQRTGDKRIKYDDVKGMESAKNALQSVLIDPVVLVYADSDEDASVSSSPARAEDGENKTKDIAKTTAKKAKKHPPRSSGVLLYGPPGTGKTMLVEGIIDLLDEFLIPFDEDVDAKRAAATEAHYTTKNKEPSGAAATNLVPAAKDQAVPAASTATPRAQGGVGVAKTNAAGGDQDNTWKPVTLFKISAADVINKWVGESEKFIKVLFRLAREMQPSVIFIDELDALFKTRSNQDNNSSANVKTQFMIECNALKTFDGQVTLIGATNLPGDIDDAVRRRMGKSLRVDLPTAEVRADILRQNLKNLDYPCEPEIFARIDELAQSKDMAYFSGADINEVVIAARDNGPMLRLHESQYYVERQGVWQRCDADTPGCIHTSYNNLIRRLHGRLRVISEPITFADLQNACRNWHATALQSLPYFEAYEEKLKASKE